MKKPQRPDDAPRPALFSERRRGSFLFWALAVAFPPGILFAVFADPPAPTSRRVGGAVFGALLYAFIMALFLGPVGREFRHLRVDAQGLWVGRRLLPAAEIGEARVLSEREGATAHATSRIDGTWLLRGVSTYSYIVSHGSAVYIRQARPDGRKRPWLLATHYPQELLAAVERVSDAAGGPAEPAADPELDDPWLP